MSRPLIAKKVHLGPKYLWVDGVKLPWALGPEVEVEDLSGDGSFWGLNLTIYGDRITVESPNGEKFDSLTEGTRAEALKIVRAGLRDVLEWLGEDVDREDD